MGSDAEKPIAQAPDGELVSLSEAYELMFGARVKDWLFRAGQHGISPEISPRPQPNRE